MSESAEALRLTRPFAEARYGQALWQLLNTLAIYAATVALMFVTVRSPDVPYVATLALAVVAAVAYMRLFMIGHDASHSSFLPKRWENVVVGNLMGVLTNTPVHYWGRQHHLHHQGNGNLDKRGNGDVQMMTIDEFRVASPGERAWYRIYRHPIFLFGIGATLHFVLLQRYPVGPQSRSWAGWRSVLGTNLGILVYYGALVAGFGWADFLAVYAPIVWLSSAGAVWLFYVQHQYEDTYFEQQKDWVYHEAALGGSSFYDLGGFLHWCCANIGYHHLHHLNPKIPNYRLPEADAALPELRARATSLGFFESLSTANLALWDASQKRLVSFREAGLGLGQRVTPLPEEFCGEPEAGH